MELHTSNVIPITSHPAFHGRRSLAEMVELLEKSIARREEMLKTKREDDGA